MKDRLSLVEQTQRDILKYISDHPEIEKLPKQEEMVEILGVSRVVVREAVSRLQALGFIETKRKKGSVVVLPKLFSVVNTIVASGMLDKDTLRDLYQLRLMLEIGMADFVFLNKTEQQVEELDEIVREEVELEEKMEYEEDVDERLRLAKRLTDVDVRFHSKLFEMTGNASLMDFQLILRHLFTLYFPKTEKRDYHTRNVVSHVGLFNLVKNGNPESFRTAMRLHLQTQFRDMDKILSKIVRCPAEDAN